MNKYFEKGSDGAHNRVLVESLAVWIDWRPGFSGTTPETGRYTHPAAVLQCAGLDETNRGHFLHVTDQLGTTVGTKAPRNMSTVSASHGMGFQLTFSCETFGWHHDNGGFAAAGHLLAIFTMAMMAGNDLIPVKLITVIPAQASTCNFLLKGS